MFRHECVPKHLSFDIGSRGHRGRGRGMYVQDEELRGVVLQADHERLEATDLEEETEAVRKFIQKKKGGQLDQ